MSLITHINEVLFEADLLNTSCKSNECLDEYEHIAEDMWVVISYNDHTFCKEMLEWILKESISLEEEDDLFLIVNKESFNDVVKKINSYFA